MSVGAVRVRGRLSNLIKNLIAMQSMSLDICYYNYVYLELVGTWI